MATVQALRAPKLEFVSAFTDQALFLGHALEGFAAKDS
jgi:hypothetical protein